jgi:hypothetical protein
MLEDTIQAIDALKKYEVRVVKAGASGDGGAHNGSGSGSDSGNRSGSGGGDGNGYSRSNGDGSSNGSNDAVRLTMSGREILVHIPPSALAKLPAVYREGNGVIRLVPVLFSQGIDMQQVCGAFFLFCFYFVIFPIYSEFPIYYVVHL